MRYYSSIAQSTELLAGISNSDTTVLVSDTSGWPVSTPFTIAIDADAPNEELVTVTSVAGGGGSATLTVQRGQDGTAAVSHTAGADVRHMSSARDFREPQEHIAATANVHGITGDLLGATSTQTVTNKTISGASNTLSNIPQSAVTGLTTALSTLTTSIANVGSSLAVVATTGAYSDLTGKPTIPATAADLSAVPTSRTVNGKALSANVTLTNTDVGAAAATHTHDDRYFTEAESDARFAGISHTHDDRYFTETESDGRYLRWNGIGSPYGVDNITNANRIGLRWNGVAPVIVVDYTEMALATRAYVDSVFTSAAKYKDNIEPVEIDPAAVLALEPVTYHRKDSDDPNSREFGLIADEVDKTLPEIVVRDGDEIEGIRYHLLAVALLSVVKDQERRIADLERRLGE